MAFEDRSTASAIQVKILVSNCVQKRAGCTVTRTRLQKETEAGGASIGAFEALLDLLNVYPQIPGGASLTVRSTSLGWEVFTRTGAVTTLILIVASNGRDPMKLALHSGRIGGCLLYTSPSPRD